MFMYLVDNFLLWSAVSSAYIIGIPFTVFVLLRGIPLYPAIRFSLLGVAVGAAFFIVLYTLSHRLILRYE